MTDEKPALTTEQPITALDSMDRKRKAREKPSAAPQTTDELITALEEAQESLNGLRGLINEALANMDTIMRQFMDPEPSKADILKAAIADRDEQRRERRRNWADHEAAEEQARVRRYGFRPQRLRTAEEQRLAALEADRQSRQRTERGAEKPYIEQDAAVMQAMAEGVDEYTIEHQQAADALAASLTDTEAVIRDILNRGNDVRDWPEDERDLHRGWIGDFTSRHAAVIELRAKKILKLIEHAPLTREHVWVDYIGLLTPKETP